VKSSDDLFVKIGSSVLFANGRKVVFGDPPNDDLVVEQKNIKSTKSVLYKSGIKQVVDAAALKQLMDRVQLLTYSDAVAQFQMDSDLFRKMRETIENLPATHFRMFDHNGKLRIFFFDCRMNDQKLRVTNEHSLRIDMCDLDIRLIRNFTFTIKTSSFLKMPLDDYVVRVGDNNICVFIPSKHDVKFLIRDQELHEPIVTFQSPRLGTEIVFAPVPNL
jgi:hypothetical protein